MKKIFPAILSIIFCLAVFHCGRRENPEKLGIGMISDVNLMEHIKFISHDLMEGRDTGSRGEMIAAQYIATQYAINGIQPGGGDGTYFQNFELVKQTPKSLNTFTFGKDGRQYSPKFKDEFVVMSAKPDAQMVTEAEVLYVGYGIDAPEYDWNDYEGIETDGKIFLMLMGEPASEDADFFKGDEVSDYGQWGYKFKIATEKGAAGVILIYDQEYGNYPWALIAGFFGRARMNLKVDKRDTSELRMMSFINQDCARDLLDFAGQSYESLLEKAGSKKFDPVNLGISLKADLESTIEDVPCRNVIGIVPGRIADEYVLYTAHTDHLGIGKPEDGDNIYNGAIDNASGCASLIEIGRVFASFPSPPERSIVLACVTAEEKGLLGSKYYAQNPVFPLNKTLAVINLDGILPWGLAKDFIFIGAERSSLKEIALKIADDNEMVLTTDLMPKENFYMRSDHYSLAQEGLPGGMLVNGFQFLDKPEEWGLEELKKWLTTVYHHPSDEFSDEWHMETVVQVNRIAFQFGCRIAGLKHWPTWNDDQPFKKIRDF
ncbi:MAG: M28 family peptidase [Candidatus Aminicenantes bacterium]|nr:M28 family peptidase [Candidatus Aminicenantes bacterium]